MDLDLRNLFDLDRCTALNFRCGMLPKEWHDKPATFFYYAMRAGFQVTRYINHDDDDVTLKQIIRSIVEKVREMRVHPDFDEEFIENWLFWRLETELFGVPEDQAEELVAEVLGEVGD